MSFLPQPLPSFAPLNHACVPYFSTFFEASQSIIPALRSCENEALRPVLRLGQCPLAHRLLGTISPSQPIRLVFLDTCSQCNRRPYYKPCYDRPDLDDFCLNCIPDSHLRYLRYFCRFIKRVCEYDNTHKRDCDACVPALFRFESVQRVQEKALRCEDR